jgi:hypothetical protein
MRRGRMGRPIWIAHAHRYDGKRFVVHAEEKLTAFLELESMIRGASGSLRRLVRPSRAHRSFGLDVHTNPAPGARAT